MYCIYSYRREFRNVLYLLLWGVGGGGGQECTVFVPIGGSSGMCCICSYRREFRNVL